MGRIIPDMIKSRQLLFDLVWKDLRVRYRYAMMGFLWAVIEPLAFTLILTFVFTFVFADRIAPAQRPAGPPFAVMLLCGLIFWQYFSASLASATTSMVNNKNLVTKVRFAREVIPITSCCVPLIQLLIGFILLLAVHLLYGGRINASLVFVPMLFLIQFLLTVGVALFLACAHVHFRDIGSLIGVLLLLGFYASPVFYPLEMVRSARVPYWLSMAYMTNPMAGLLTCYRQVVLESRFPEFSLLIWPIICSLLAFVGGTLLFRRFAPTMSDYL